jgi:Ca2+-binding RTX toxin-like protein
VLSKRQWQWCADHELGIKLVLLYLFLVFLLVYTYNFLSVFWWNNKIPLQYQSPILKSDQLGCQTFDVYEMFIPAENKLIALNGDYSNYQPDPLERSDARYFLLENHRTVSWGSEILEKRPDCLGAFIADKQGWPEPIGMRVVDRSNGETLYAASVANDTKDNYNAVRGVIPLILPISAVTGSMSNVCTDFVRNILTVGEISPTASSFLFNSMLPQDIYWRYSGVDTNQIKPDSAPAGSYSAKIANNTEKLWAGIHTYDPSYANWLPNTGGPGLAFKEEHFGRNGTVRTYTNGVRYTLYGGDGDDVLVGFTPSNDSKQTLAAGESDNDTLRGGRGNDSLYGGLGNDTLDGGEHNDLIFGDAGNDTLFGSAGEDELDGGAGNDSVDGGAGIDKIFGGVGNDTLWGGSGNDILVGFTPSNDSKQSLSAGETDDDTMYGGTGDDFMVGAFGNDQMWGGIGNDEAQGGVGDDQLYGEEGNDRLFGGAGNDVIYGGTGDDIIVGGAASNEAGLAAGVSDSNFLYGGTGNDIIIGGIGNDYIDGGAGADQMEGGKGDDIYIVNSVNDVILEHAGEGYDTVIASNNAMLGTNVEELRLLEGGNFNGTGNSGANKLIGNSQANILDGVTGADIMIGGQGNDIYYVDDLGDRVIELAGEGNDTVLSSISHTLGAQIENLGLLDFSKPEKGVADGVDILVYGYPKANELDYMQGNAVRDYAGTCALTSIANLAIQANQNLSEAQVVQRAIDNQWCVTDSTVSDYERGGSNYLGQRALLDSYGIRNGLMQGYNEQGIANLIKGGRGVIIAVNAGKLWGEDAYLDGGAVNHVVTVTGVACDAATGAINGFYIADSGRGLVSDMTRYLSLEEFRRDANVANAYSIYTIDPIKLRNENIDGTGNELANIITGNRGDNILTGGRGNDTIIGQAGNDTYRFSRGDGIDTIIDSDATQGNIDVLELSGIHQQNLWFRHVGDDLQINVMGTADQIVVKGWYGTGAQESTGRIERIKTADGLNLHDTDVEQFVQAMAGFAAPSAAQTSWTNGQTSNGRILMTVTH